MKNVYKPFQRALFAILTLAIAACVENNVEDANAYCLVIEQSLIQAGICTDLNQCDKNNYALCGGSDPWTLGKERVRLYVYGISDPRVMELIAKNVSAETARRKGAPSELQFFKGTSISLGFSIKTQMIE